MKKITVKLMCVLFTLVLLLTSVSCAQVKAGALSGGYTRNQTGEATVTDDFETAMANFSLELFRRTLSEDRENDLISPLSAMMCLALLANGADGETRAQMEAALGMRMEDLNPALYAFAASTQGHENGKVSYANSIWFRDDGSISVKKSFLQTNADWYGAQVYKEPFDSATVDKINQWVRENTMDMIDSIVEKVSPETVMYLFNALAFDAKWSDPYTVYEVKDRTFTNADGSKVTVDMMLDEAYCYLLTDGATGFGKEYQGGAYSFVGLLPDEGIDVYDFAESLEGETWLAMWEERHHKEIDTGLPVFSYEAECGLIEALRAMGMTDVFDPSRSDLSALGSSKNGALFCTAVQQKAVIEVNTEGTRAAAITDAEVSNTSAYIGETKSVILDRPFVYAIVDNATGLPLFLGVVSHLS